MVLATQSPELPPVSFHSQPSNIILRARSSTSPRRVVITRRRGRQIVCHLPSSKNSVSVTRPQHKVAHDIIARKADAAQVNRFPYMASTKNSSQEAGPDCKRKPEDEVSGDNDTTNKLARKDVTVDIDAVVEDEYDQLPPLPSPASVPHPSFVHCMPPEDPTYRKYSVFTAGSIEMGKAVQWQKHMATLLSTLPITVNNPRRGHWDPNVTKEAKDESFRHQVEWELSALEKADVICFFFDINTKSPVTMLELGLWASSGKIVVCCDKRFWRAGNIHIVCERYNIPFVEKFEDLAPAIKNMLHEKGMRLDENGDLIE